MYTGQDLLQMIEGGQDHLTVVLPDIEKATKDAGSGVATSAGEFVDLLKATATGPLPEEFYPVDFLGKLKEFLHDRPALVNYSPALQNFATWITDLLKTAGLPKQPAVLIDGTSPKSRRRAGPASSTKEPGLNNPSFGEKASNEVPDDTAGAQTFSEKTSIASHPGTEETQSTGGVLQFLSNLASDFVSARSNWVTKTVSTTGSQE